MFLSYSGQNLISVKNSTLVVQIRSTRCKAWQRQAVPALLHTIYGNSGLRTFFQQHIHLGFPDCAVAV